MTHKNNYIFTNKENPPKGILSTILGVLSAVSMVLVIYLTFRNKGYAEVRYGFTALVAALFSLTGLILGILSRMEPDKFYFFSYLGIGLNTLLLAGMGFLLFAGVYGL